MIQLVKYSSEELPALISYSFDRFLRLDIEIILEVFVVHNAGASLLVRPFLMLPGLDNTVP